MMKIGGEDGWGMNENLKMEELLNIFWNSVVLEEQRLKKKKKSTPKQKKNTQIERC